MDVSEAAARSEVGLNTEMVGCLSDGRNTESFGLDSESEYVKNEQQSSTRRQNTVRSLAFGGKKAAAERLKRLTTFSVFCDT